METKQHNITQRDFNDEKISEEKMKEPQQNVESGPSTINKCLNGNSIEVSKIIQKKREHGVEAGFYLSFWIFLSSRDNYFFLV
jgi:hypothetical protein